ncbi:hypothetical protein E4O04_09540 [Treponema sp. OMZ 799]|nr:hypothetical protein [Treponema sp. OMZ 799]UTC78231.1 hypothetical protein E4O04_09540 [Treponema sp. OMZ 799]
MNQSFKITLRNDYAFKRVFGIEDGSIQAPKMSVACIELKVLRRQNF